MDFGIFHKDVKNSLDNKKALGIKVGLVGLLLVIISFSINIVSEMFGQLMLSIGILIGFAGIFIHVVSMFNFKK